MVFPDLQPPVVVIGAGLAGCEAAVQLARRGIAVELLEMKPEKFSPAHKLDGPAELVCSNSLKSDLPDSAHGLLKNEMRKMGSVVLQAAEQARVPAGSALAVDRQVFSDAVREILASYPEISYCQGTEVADLPEGDVIIATGPLTGDVLTEKLKDIIGLDSDMYFYDALAPIIDADSIDYEKAYFASRWGKGDAEDYLNCPLNKEEYEQFVSALKHAPRTSFRTFEQQQYFEGCIPIEVLADRGNDTLAFGPMRPVGLERDGGRFHAVVQLRAENKEKTAYNIVGFQTKMTHAGQQQVFRMIPGLENAKFLRYGAVHRNFYVNSPQVLNETFELKNRPKSRLAGQITGVEGYIESAAMGILVGLWVAQERRGLPVAYPPRESALGSLYAHVRGESGLPSKVFEPMNIHFGLLPAVSMRGRKNRRAEAVKRATLAFDEWLQKQNNE
jgi:methylenetetrahydrofolate--tRNA-(uracil-5-)-methyltransferase